MNNYCGGHRTVLLVTFFAIDSSRVPLDRAISTVPVMDDYYALNLMGEIGVGNKTCPNELKQKHK
jgi:hypothetical protein